MTFFKSRELTCVKDPRLDVYVYGLSYYDREIKEGLYDKAVPIQEEGIHILLAHGGDEKHIPLSAASWLRQDSIMWHWDISINHRF